MTPWTAQPSAALAMDLRLLVATPEVQALVFRLGHASRGGRVPFATSAETAVRAACGGADWAVTALDAAVEAGFILVEESALVLGWEWPVLAVERPVTATAEPSAASSHAPSVAAALGLTADALRRAAWKFKRRLDRWSVVPSGVTWESVLEPASPWHALLKTDARRTGTVPGHRDGTGTRPGSSTGTVPGRTGTPLPPSHSPLPSEKEERRDDGDTRETGTPQGTKQPDTGTHRDAPGRTGTVDAAATDKTEEAVAVVAALVEGSGGEIPAPDLATARHLGGALLAAGVTLDEARAWGADLATPAGRKITWPWLRQTDRRIDAAFLRSCDMSRGEEPFVRVRDGLSAWRHTRVTRLKVRARSERRETPSDPAPTVEDTVATMRALAAEKAARKAAQKTTSTTEAEHHGG